MTTTFSGAINKAFFDSMKEDKKVICMGLGVTDPKGVFGTTTNLEKYFGPDRVMDIPTSENSVTGICAGLAIAGFKPILTHQRLDFAILSLDQIINNISKVRYMFGGQISCPVVIRMIIGRGWGQGPTHSQNLQLLFAGIPGLRVAIPSSPQDAYSLLRASIDSMDPIIFLEHRWLHNSITKEKLTYEKDSLKSQKVLKEGEDFTIVATSYMVPEALRALKHIEKNTNLSGSLINFRNYSCDLTSEIISNVKNTKNVIFADTAQKCFSIGHNILQQIRENIDGINHSSIICMPNVPVPTSHFLTKDLYVGSREIISKLAYVFELNATDLLKDFEEPEWHDVPGEWFKGPF